jgi:hypothetical protein
MKPSSAKAKGRLLQQWVRDKILLFFPKLLPDDVRSTSMGAGGEDIQLSPAARSVFPFSVECKNLASSAVYRLYEQAEANAGKHVPLLILKANRKRPLAIVDAEWFIVATTKLENNGKKN